MQHNFVSNTSFTANMNIRKYTNYPINLAGDNIFYKKTVANRS